MCYVIHLKTQVKHSNNSNKKERERRNGIIVIEINRESGNWLFLSALALNRAKKKIQEAGEEICDSVGTHFVAFLFSRRLSFKWQNW
jgi:hypothetical protein